MVKSVKGASPPLKKNTAKAPPQPKKPGKDHAIGGGNGPDREGVIKALDDGLVETQEILQAFHRSALCHVQPPHDLISEQSQYLTRFGGWLDLNMGRGLLDQPAFEQLTEAYGTFHENLRWLARRAWKGGKVPTDEYDSLTAKADAVTGQIRRLLRLFRTAEVTVDPLTGVQNRTVMHQTLEREIMRIQRTDQEGCVVLADIDFFKKVNDTYGHQAGDVVLAKVASEIQSSLRPYDSLFRYGGEEFVICMPVCKTTEARATLERVRKQIEGLPILIEGGQSVTVTCSFGVARLDPDLGVQQSIEVADMALYKAKETGRNRVVVAEARKPEKPEKPRQA